MRPVVNGTAIAIVLLAALSLQFALVARTGFQAGDFRAFYCAARVTVQGADPYRTGPLHACETSVGPQKLFEKEPRVTVPAPLPGYVLAAFVPLTVLPFAPAAAVWLTLLAIATVAGSIFLARSAGTDWQTALAVLGVSVGVASIPFGEVVPVAIGAICACGYFAARERWWPAALCAAVAMIEPHLGLPVCLALLVWSGRARVPVVILLAALGALSLTTLGLATNIEYFAQVLPAHALSEAARDTQYSVTGVLTSFGVRDVLAARIGFAEYLVMLALGTYVAGVLARSTGNRAFLAFVPPAFAVFGGTFIHVTQVAAALPAAVLLLTQIEGKIRTIGIFALLALSVPWIMAWSPALGLAPVIPIGFLAWHYWRNVRTVMLAAIVAFVLLMGISRAYAGAAMVFTKAPVTSRIDPNFAEASWGDFSRRSSTASLATWIARLPSWAGLATLLSLLVIDATYVRKRRTAEDLAETAT